MSDPREDKDTYYLDEGEVVRSGLESEAAKYVKLGEIARGGGLIKLAMVQEAKAEILLKASRDRIHEEALRRFLWLNHGHAEDLYGDDGEMQCRACMPTWDYKRAPLAEVFKAAEEAASPLRKMYKRLAEDYRKRPTVPDLGGGAPGDKYPL